MQKYLININNLNEIEEYKKVGISNFLFALKDFSIGYNSFDINEIPDNSYILINRIMNTKDIDSLKKIIDKLNRFKGIIFEDLGIFNILKNSNMKLELIWNQSHFQTNYNSINYYLNNGCSSAILSNEITSNEIKEIIDKVDKPVIFNIFGRNMIMYSRRKLLSNFNNYNNLENYNNMTLEEMNTNNYFYVKEDKNGTVIFNKEYFNYINFSKSLDVNKIKYYLILNLDLKPNEIIDIIINNKLFGNDGFLNKKTVYKMSEYTDR